jgi:polysaccharide export outer membrane protein
MGHLLLSLVVVIAAGWSQAAPAKPAAKPDAAQPHNAVYKIGPTDVLGIKVFGEEALSNTYTVDSDGSITFPLIGRVAVSGRTTRQIEEQLVKLLDGDYLKRPQISVEIATFRSRSIFVLGEVRNPGRYTIQGPQTLLEVIAHAGSTTAAAGDAIIVQRYKDGIASAITAAMPGDDRTAEVMRVSLEDLRQGRLSANILLQDSDTIIVPPADRFYVQGFVKQPGSFVLRPGMTVRQAISEAGGITERGSTRGIKIIRRINDKDVELDAQMSDLVRPNDTIRIRQRLI